MKVRVLGVEIGSASGWDEHDVTIFSFYDFKASITGLKDSECIFINFESGELSYINDATSTAEETINILPIISPYGGMVDIPVSKTDL